MGWNFGDILDGVEGVVPSGAVALVHGAERVSWGEFAQQSNALASALRRRGLRSGQKLAICARNSNAYLIAVSACFKARLVHVNVNFRYRGEELRYILDNSDAKALIFDSEFAGHIAAVVATASRVRHWIQIGGTPSSPAISLEEVIGSGSPKPLRIERSPDDLLLLYTGGTTGIPKGVMWRASDLFRSLGTGATIRANRGKAPHSLGEHLRNVEQTVDRLTQVIACPLMHGTGLVTSLLTLSGGGCLVTLEGRSFDPAELNDSVERDRVQSAVIVGDAFARPIVEALEAQPERWDMSSLRVIISSGTMWSREIKQRMIERMPKVRLVDMFGSSETQSFGSASTTANQGTRTAVFSVGPETKVFTEDHREVVPGSGVRGLIAKSGPIPLGYYKDPEKTARTFPVIDGVRYAIPGDWCVVDADGSITLLGRGSACLNSAGEKIFPEEVEEALKTHPDVLDAIVVGLPDPRWGQSVTGIVQLRRGSVLHEERLREHVRSRLAGYKVPKRVLRTEAMFRGPNGKADYEAARVHAMRVLGKEARTPQHGAGSSTVR